MENYVGLIRESMDHKKRKYKSPPKIPEQNKEQVVNKTKKRGQIKRRLETITNKNNSVEIISEQITVSSSGSSSNNVTVITEQSQNIKIRQRKKIRTNAEKTNTNKSNSSGQFRRKTHTDFISMYNKYDVPVRKDEELPCFSKIVEEYDKNNITSQLSSDMSVVSLDDTNNTKKIIRKNPKTQKNGEYFSIGNDKLVIIYPSRSIYFHGFATLKVISGKVEILGYIATPKSGELKVYSPRGSALLFIKNCFSSESKNTVVLSEICKQFEGANNINKNCAVIICKKLEEHKISYLERHIPHVIFPSDNTVFPRIIFEPNPNDYNLLQINDNWDNIISDITNINSRLMIVGGKSVGKSTFLRYTVNKILSTHDTVRVIDLDPGQSEFTPPGLLSVVDVKRPLLGPNFTHLQSAKVSYLCDISVGANPSYYIQQIQNLREFVDTRPEKKVILINTAGFVRGMGTSLLAAIVGMLNPTRLVQINGNKPNNNLEEVFKMNVALKNNKFNIRFSSNLNYEVIVIESSIKKKDSWSFEPRQSREICIAAYFSKTTLYETRLSKIKIQNLDGRLLQPAAINANLVALCNKKICFGYAIVKAIDINADKLYIITPIEEKNVLKVDKIVVGSVTLPPSIIMTTEGATGLVPYVGLGQLSEFAQFTKRTYVPPKKVK